jgi:hypothetical protein
VRDILCVLNDQRRARKVAILCLLKEHIHGRRCQRGGDTWYICVERLQCVGGCGKKQVIGVSLVRGNSHCCSDRADEQQPAGATVSEGSERLFLKRPSWRATPPPMKKGSMRRCSDTEIVLHSCRRAGSRDGPGWAQEPPLGALARRGFSRAARRRESSCLLIQAGASQNQRTPEWFSMEILSTRRAGLDVQKKTVKVC